MFEWYEAIKQTKKCLVCGNDDVRVLDFHHRDDNKTANVSYLACNGFRRETILVEMEKCDVLCANCHRIHHYEARKEERQKKDAEAT